MPFTTLIDTDALAARLDDPTLVIVDCRFVLDDVAWGEREYEAAHIPGAVYAHLDRDLSGPKSGTNGRHPLPAPEAAAAAFGRLSIGADAQVVAYDQDAGMYAARIWWMLRWLGHDRAAVLDGGFKKWRAEGRPVRAGAETRPARTFVPAVHPEMVVDVRRVGALARDPAWRVLDARAPERYRGESEMLDRVAGHIPGAGNYFMKQNLTADGTFKAPEELRAGFAPALAGTDPSHVVNYCGSGVSACLNLLALEHAGLRGAKLYPGSWSEWTSDESRPIGRGNEAPVDPEAGAREGKQ